MLDGAREALYGFFETGGNVLFVIFAFGVAMWTLIVERFWFLYRVYPKQADEVVAEWNGRSDRSSWSAVQIRRLLISGVSLDLHRYLNQIQALIVLCPLLGLLGTAAGMIEVYDVLAALGGSNARAIAAGVSKAMVTTMAGLVVALSGLVCSSRLKPWVGRELTKLEQRLPIAQGSPTPRRLADSP